MRLLSRASRRAFSLVEVLLAILILALGLLGLGAIIPVVVKQQKTAADWTAGVAAGNEAIGYLLSRPDFSVNATAGINAWDYLLADPNWSAIGTLETHYLWQVWKPSLDSQLDLDTGDMTFDASSANPSTQAVLTLGARLWPGASMQPIQRLGPGRDPYQPRFVWDIIGRRIATKAGEPEAVQVALFVRRIDMNIRVPIGNSTANQPYTLRDVLTVTNGINNQDHCVPVAVELPNDPIPTNRGNRTPGVRTYGNFLCLDATFDPARRNRIELFSGAIAADQNPSGTNPETLLTLASQADQKLLDSFGNVYTVLRVDEDASLSTGNTVVVVSPPIPPSVSDLQPPGGNTPDPNASFRQIVFTPQIAAAVEVFTVTRPIK